MRTKPQVKRKTMEAENPHDVLSGLIEECPDHGTIGITCFYRNGSLVRIVTSREISMLPLERHCELAS